MSIRTKLFVFLGGIIVAIIVAVVVMDSLFLKKYYISSTDKKMQMVGEDIAHKYNDDYKHISKYMSNIHSEWVITCRIIDSEYNIKNTSSRNQRGKLGRIGLSIQEFIKNNKEELEPGKVISTQLTDADDNVTKLVYVKMLDENRCLVLSKSTKAIEESMEISNKFFIIIGTVLLTVAMIIVGIVSTKISKSLKDMSNVAGKIASLDFSQQVKIVSNDEIGSLGQSINSISNKLNSSINELKEDITKRQELVRDISHELKTPIAAVKGYAEGLKFGVTTDPEKMSQYCEVIVSECDRMDMLVRQMIELSRMEMIEENIIFEVIKVEDIVENVSQRFQSIADNKSVQLIFETDLELMFEAEPEMMLKAVFNYVDNAIRYTPSGGKVILTIERKADAIDICVYNSGSHIQEENIGKIWNTFFKEDPSRYRGDDKNYGIGLAIVKTVVDKHSGEVYVENLEDGVCFGMIIPVLRRSKDFT